jgi:hypothetical protein
VTRTGPRVEYEQKYAAYKETMNTLTDESAVESTNTLDLVSLIPELTDLKADREFLPDGGRGALVAKLALTKVR